MKVASFECLIGTGLTIRSLADEMILNRFDEDSQSGFDIERVTKTEISGFFLNRRTRRINIFKPNGASETLTSESVEKIGFNLSQENKLLLLFDPGYNAREFVSKMASVSRFKISLEPFFAKMDILSASLEARIDKNQITKIFLKNVTFSTGIVGSLAAKGNLPGAALAGVIGKMKGTVARLEVSWKSERLLDEIIVMISENGRFNIQKCDSSETARQIVTEILHLPTATPRK